MTMHSDDDVRSSSEPGMLYERTLPDGRVLQLLRQLFNWRLAVGPAHSQIYDAEYDFAAFEEAYAALATWDGAAGTEPSGWIRHFDVRLRTYRRRPDGGPTREYTAD